MKKISIFLGCLWLACCCFGQSKPQTTAKPPKPAATTKPATATKPATNKGGAATKNPADTTKTPTKTPAAKDNAAPDQTSQTVIALVNIGEKRAFQEIPVSKNGEILLSTIPDTLRIYFATPYDGYNIQFNKDASKNKFVTSFSATKDDAKTVYLSENWINYGLLTLIFNKGYLVGMLGRPSPITNHIIELDSSKHAYIKILYPKKTAGPEKLTNACGLDSLVDSSVHQVVVDNEFEPDYRFVCREYTCSTCGQLAANKMNESRIAVPFQLCTSDNKKDIMALTQYKVVYDRRPGHSQFQYYTLNSKKKCYEPKNKIYPKADEKITYYLVVPSGVGYTLNSTSLNLFVDTALLSAINAAMAGVSGQVAPANQSAGNAGNADNAGKAVVDSVMGVKGITEGLDNAQLAVKLKDPKLKAILDASKTKNIDSLILLHNQAADFLSMRILKKIDFSDSSQISKSKSKQYQPIFANIFSTIKLLKDSITKPATVTNCDSLLDILTTLRAGKDTLSVAIKKKNLLISLKIALEDFNLVNNNIDFHEEDYRASLL